MTETEQLLRSENECLRAEIERLRTLVIDNSNAADSFHLEIERLRASNAELLAALQAIARRTAPSTRTFDTSIRDMGLANDLARAAIEKAEVE